MAWKTHFRITTDTVLFWRVGCGQQGRPLSDCMVHQLHILLLPHLSLLSLFFTHILDSYTFFMHTEKLYFSYSVGFDYRLLSYFKHLIILHYCYNFITQNSIYTSSVKKCDSKRIRSFQLICFVWNLKFFLFFTPSGLMFRLLRLNNFFSILYPGLSNKITK